MAKMSSTMFSVGTLLRHAEDSGAVVKVLVQGAWLTGRVIGCDAHGVVIDGGRGEQFLVRLESVVAVSFAQAQFEDDGDLEPSEPRAHGGSEPIVAGPVSVPEQPSGVLHLVSPVQS